MRQSKLFLKTIKERPAGAESSSRELLVRAGYIDQLMAGVYSFLPLGFRVLKKIENIIRENMVKSPVNGQEILMPVLQPKENWQKTNRWDNFDVLFRLKGSGDKEYALGPTHEEVVAPLAKKNILSYRDLPFSVFQIQTKFRDELRAKSGLLRTREFLMKDLYSFHATQEDLDKYYNKLAKVYLNVFKQCGIGKLTYRALASGGSFSKYSDEFQTLTEAGEDIIYICKKCGLAINKDIKNENPICPKCKSSEFEEKKAVEVGNIFKLGSNFSRPFDLKFRDKEGIEKPVIMGCFGIGLGRLMGAVAEVSHDEKGIIWPKPVAPFLVHLIYVVPPQRDPAKREKSSKVYATAERIYNTLLKENIEVLFDDRQDKTAGEKFADADLIGIPARLVVSEKTEAVKSIEIKMRNSAKAKLIPIKGFINTIKKL